ncbi:MAG: hypothetical protein SGARI_002218 [Bacillariaceae sp.]
MGGGGSVSKDTPVFFTKPNDGVVLGSSSCTEEGEPRRVSFPSNTENLHYECELVVALGNVNGNNHNNNEADSFLSVDQAVECIFGFAMGIDLTRRDLQQLAKDRSAPWDLAKHFDQSAPVSTITQMSLAELELESNSSNLQLQCHVNGVLRQSCVPLQDMIWSIPEIISELSRSYQLRPGDLIMSGTPAGVGPVSKGDQIVGRLVDGSALVNKDVLQPVEIVIV